MYCMWLIRYKMDEIWNLLTVEGHRVLYSGNTGRLHHGVTFWIHKKTAWLNVDPSTADSSWLDFAQRL